MNKSSNAPNRSPSTPDPPPPPPETPLSADQTWALLSGIAGDALRWLERWMHEKAMREETGEARDLNSGITALGRLTETCKKIQELKTHESTDSNQGDSESIDAEICQALARLKAEGEDEDDPESLPD